LGVKKFEIIPTEPRCGDCTACCESTGFTGDWKKIDRYNEAEASGIDFGPWSTCNKLCSTGCSIQDTKPRTCTDFFCHFIEHDLEDKFRPKEFGYIAFTSLDKNSENIEIMSLDHTLPAETQYNNNKKMLDELIDKVRISLGKEYVYATLHTKKSGIKRIR